MIIYIDMDGCICKFVEGACVHHKRATPYKDSLFPQSWDMWNLWQMTESDFFNGMEHNFWENLNPYWNAKELVELCLTAAGGKDNVYFLSTPSRNIGSYSGKAAWVYKHFPHMYRNLKLDTAKHHQAAPGRLLIDDSDKNVDLWREHGGDAVLWPQPWNRNYNLIGQGLTLVQHAIEEMYCANI